MADELDDPVRDCCALFEGKDFVNHALEQLVEALLVECTAALLLCLEEELMKLDDIFLVRRAVGLCLLEYRDNFILDVLVRRQSRGHCGDEQTTQLPPPACFATCASL